jgi:hypothetical protein
MPSFEDMQNLYANVGSNGQQLKAMADDVMQQTWDNDIQTRLCYLYDYYHDDQFDKGLSGYNPALSRTKIPVKLKFIVKTYKSVSKDDPEYHIMFEPNVWNTMSCKPEWFANEYEKYGVRFPVGLYVDIPDDRGIYQKWLVVYDEVANQFPKFGILKCNYLFTWVKDDKIHRYKRKMWGVEKTQNSYTSGTWQGDKLNVLDEQGKFWLPWNLISSEIKHDMRFFISMLQEEPYVYKASKIKNTAPKGIIAITIEQDRFDQNKDYVNLDTGEMYADYYSSTIAPEEVDVTKEQMSDILSIEAKTYKVRINGGSKVVNAKILDLNGNDVTNKYNNEVLEWKFYIEDQELDNSFVKLDATYNSSSDNTYKHKFYFLGNEDFLNKKLTVKLSINNLSASADLDIVS